MKKFVAFKNLRTLTTLVLFLYSLSAFCQDNKDILKPTLSVTGKAKISVKPDLAILTLNVSEVRATMGEAVTASEATAAYFGDMLKKMGFKERDLKTIHFSVSKNTIYRNNESLDSGFIASRVISIEFGYNQQTLQKCISEFSKSSKPVSFSFDFRVSDELLSKVRRQLIEDAVKDANQNAEAMAKAAKVKLISVFHLSYGAPSQINPMDMMYRKNLVGTYMAQAPEAMQALSLTPDEVDIEDSVSMVWVIGE